MEFLTGNTHTRSRPGYTPFTEVEVNGPAGLHWREPTTLDTLDLLKEVGVLREENMKLKESPRPDLLEVGNKALNANQRLMQENTKLMESLDRCALALGKRVLGLDK